MTEIKPVGLQSWAQEPGHQPAPVRHQPTMILSAQAVPSASRLPCLTALPSGWHVGGADITSGHARFWLDSDQVGAHAVTITLTAACDTSGAQQIPSDQPELHMVCNPPPHR